MSIELLRTEAADGLLLDGLLYGSETVAARTPVLLIHGAATALGISSFPDVFGRLLAAAGRGFLETTTRGAGWIVERSKRADGRLRSVIAGHAFEKFEECLWDIDAWIGELSARGAGGVVVMGRSLGCQKLAYYLSERADARVKAVIFGMPGDPVNQFRQFVGPDRYREFSERARRMIAQGRGRELADFGLGGYFRGEWLEPPPDPLPPDGAWEYQMSAQAYLSLFGEGTPRDVFSYARADGGGLWRLGEITVPMLTLTGDVDERMVGDPAEALARIRAAATAAPRCDTEVLRGVPHTWRGHEEPVAGLIKRWLDEAVPE